MKKFLLSFSIIFFTLSLFSADIYLVGKTSPEQILLIKEWKNIYELYQPDLETIDKINSYNKDLSAKVYVGTWCRDSKNNIPKLIKIFENINNLHAEYIGILWRDCEPTDVYKNMNIKRIPTIIFYHHVEEIGRIIENPVNTLEKDILDIISK